MAGDILQKLEWRRRAVEAGSLVPRRLQKRPRADDEGLASMQIDGAPESGVLCQVQNAIMTIENFASNNAVDDEDCEDAKREDKDDDEDDDDDDTAMKAMM
jgi:hypothetical protein